MTSILRKISDLTINIDGLEGVSLAILEMEQSENNIEFTSAFGKFLLEASAAGLTAILLRPLFSSIRMGLAISGQIWKWEALTALTSGLAGNLIGNIIDEINENNPGGLLYDWLNPVEEMYFNSARPQGDASPLVLDLDGDGVETTGINDSYAYFDHNRDGFAERTGWAGADDGILVRDLNGNGQIDNGGELFGDNTLINGARAANGFEALKALDTNQDGQFSNSDTTWNSVKVWKDSNSNTQVDSGELLTLAQANVASINLGYYDNYSNGVEANGNDHKQVSHYQDTSGNSKSISDVWFKANRTDSVDTVQVPISTAIQSLFDLRGTGTLVSLHKAMALDTTGALQAFVSQLQTKLAGSHTVAQLLLRVTGLTSPFLKFRHKSLLFTAT